MSGKRDKKIRKEATKQNKAVFYAFVVEVSAWPFFKRLSFCLKMAFMRHPLQKEKQMLDVIKERRKLIKAGKIIGE